MAICRANRLSDNLIVIHTFRGSAASMRAAFPRTENPETPALQRTQLRDDSYIQQVSSVECVHLSTTERYQLDCFIGQYIKTRDLASVPNIDTTLRATLQLYPGKPPVMVNELNAWIDRKLGYRATHPDFCEQEDV